MKDVLIVSHYYHFEYEKESSRYKTLCKMLSTEQEISLELVTSSFYHRTKKQRNRNKAESSESFKVTLIDEPTYQKNISLRRLYSSHIFARNVISYIKKRKKPDLIYQVVPSLDVADVVTLYARQNDIPLVIDIQDLWPEAFRMAIDIPVISDILFAPMMKKANRIYSRADAIIAVSNTYVSRGLDANPACNMTACAYIGGDVDLIERESSKYSIEKPENEFWIAYAGALGHSYDISIVIKALSKLQSQNIKKVVFHIMGDGPLREKFEKESSDAGINTIFYGHLSYGHLMAILSKADVAVNPINSKSVASIINKVSDYALSSLPVINTQPSSEYCNLIEEFSCGFNCCDDKANAIARCIWQLIISPDLRKTMQQGAARLGNSKFNRSLTYQHIIQCIKSLLNIS